MSTHLITGYAGKEHITSADQGSFNAAVMGGGEFILERGEQFRCQVVSNNKVRIYDGDALMQGRHIIIDRNTYEETTHDNGTQGYKRIDLIVLTYEKNAVTSVESVKLEVIKGAPSESNPTVPEYTKGDILNSGASKNQMPLYQIPFDGLSIGEPVKMFSTVPTLEGMKENIDGKVDEKIAEFEEDFAELEAGIEDKIAEAGKPVVSNAADWAMLENYGEYSADAKTVGEEFAKVNNSLTAENSQTFQFAYDSESGKYGYKAKVEGADTFFPFSSSDLMELDVIWESGQANTTHTYTVEKDGIYLSYIICAGYNLSLDIVTTGESILNKKHMSNGQLRQAQLNVSRCKKGDTITFSNTVDSQGFYCFVAKLKNNVSNVFLRADGIDQDKGLLTVYAQATKDLEVLVIGSANTSASVYSAASTKQNYNVENIGNDTMTTSLLHMLPTEDTTLTVNMPGKTGWGIVSIFVLQIEY